ncbi:DNA internalization-related competence protein ComEC/Rec2 [Aestuariibacter sp. AA17]|uniref:DNA internalization-related competence protein ComEC/Rec2 n=1 Tax=Fluctibacter corallii TaxID=2984329 RepID=A0ABT3A5N9_9ALTE|nr:DNA internalization-related competence protein ComEC/Rec2 [Aestuariibacter sp. AA17]MCV2883907.1 DNA internalization-related competence protein ComEC/Rec2 [Aestuariibacter sp. AA17]
MNRWVFSFITGAVSSLLWPALPPTWTLPCLFLAILIAYKLHLKGFSGLLCGIFWMASVGHTQASWQLSFMQIASIQRVQGQIVDISHHPERAVFIISMHSSDLANTPPFWLPKPKIRLVWKHPPTDLSRHDHIHVAVKLKPTHGLANEGGFAFDTWLRSQGGVATGYVQSKASGNVVEAIVGKREKILNQLQTLKLSQHKWIAALALGDRSHFSDDDWHMLQRTGLSHLVAISGLHLAMVASGMWLLARLSLISISYFSPLTQTINYKVGVTILVLLGCIAYAWLSGFALPVLRACFMMSIVSLFFLFRWTVGISQIISLSLLAMILVEPLGMLSGSFWLSVIALCSVLMVYQVVFTQAGQADARIGKRVVHAVGGQFMLNLMMLPIVAVLFQHISLIAPLVNIVAVPVFTFILLPLCLIGVLLMMFYFSLGDTVLTLANDIFAYALIVINWISVQPFAASPVEAMPWYVWVMFAVAILGIVILRSILSVGVASILLLPIVTHAYEPKKQDTWQIDVLDVGQGLSVVIRKNNRSILYDVGAAFDTGFNMADAVIHPFYAFHRLLPPDRIFLSHLDNDHAGSLPYIQWKHSEQTIIVSADHCVAGQVWQWQGLQIEALWPLNPVVVINNHTSCVLRISDGHNQVLLTGDIDLLAEYLLVNEYLDDLRSDVLIAPHHGSNTSSSSRFISAVKPDIVVFSQGFWNRWDFPRQSVIERYVRGAPEAKLLSTSEEGQISIEFHPQYPDSLMVKGYRKDINPLWYRQ